MSEEFKQLPDGWVVKKLGDLCNSISETCRLHKDDKIIFLNTSDIFSGKFLHSNYSKVISLPGQAKKAICYNDILYSEIRPRNKRFALVNFSNTKDYIVSTKLMVLRANDCISPKYLYLVLSSNEKCEEFQSIAESRSGTFPQITFDVISNCKINLPPPKEQREIAAVLSALDDKIEVNQQINKKLEEMAQAIFKQWFIDFNFPDENGNPYKDSGGAMIDSELGQIPESWITGTLSDIYEIFDSLRIPLSSRQRSNMDKLYPYYGATSIMDYVDNYIFNGNYILLGEDGTVIDNNGFPILQYVWGKFWVNNHAHVLKGKKPFSDEYLYLLLKQTNVRSIVTGAVQLKINQGNLSNMKMVISNKNVVVSFNEIVKQMFSDFKNNNDEINCLKKIRDSLLPKLMSGKVRLAR